MSTKGFAILFIALILASGCTLTPLTDEQRAERRAAWIRADIYFGHGPYGYYGHHGYYHHGFHGRHHYGWH